MLLSAAGGLLPAAPLATRPRIALSGPVLTRLLAFIRLALPGLPFLALPSGLTTGLRLLTCCTVPPAWLAGPLAEIELFLSSGAVLLSIAVTGLRLLAVPGEGVLVTLEAVISGAWGAAPEPLAHGARVWLVNVGEVMGNAWLRRFTRLGWAVSRFASYKAAAAQLAKQPLAARPPIVVVVESGNPLTDGAASLPDLLPEWTRLIHAVPAGSSSLREQHSVPGYEVHVFQFSPRQLDHFASELQDHDAPSGQTRPTPLESMHVPPVLLVDDSPVNLIVGQAMLEALGYSVHTVAGGHEAVKRCQTGPPPDLVLMDVNMRDMNGIAATKQLKVLQRQGTIPPFPIVGFTAAWTDELHTQCLQSGMDECLPKPLPIDELGPRLRQMVTIA